MYNYFPNPTHHPVPPANHIQQL